MLARPGITARWAPVGLGVVLLVLTGLAVWVGVSTSRAAAHAARAGETSAAFEDARYAVGQEESLERKYRLEPSSQVRGLHRAASRDMTAALRAAAASGDPRQRAVVRSVLTRQTAYLASIDRMFAAKDAGRENLVLVIDGREVDPSFAAIEREVDAAAAAARADATRALRRLDRVESMAVIARPVVLAIGLILLGLFTWALMDAVRRNRTLAEASRHQALHDSLTGLPNRILFYDRLEQALLGAEREQEPLAVLIVDLDRFKEVNDTMGHANGDLLLQQVGPRLRAALRARDTIARMGGDEFAVLLPGTDIAGSRQVAQSLHDALEQPFELESVTLATEASVGVAHYPEHGNTAETLLQRADVAMYMAKKRALGPRLLRPRERPPRPEPPRARGRAAAGHQRRRARAALPAQDRPAHRPGLRRRGPRALGPPHPRAARSRGVRPARRARRAHAPAHPLGARSRARPVPGVARPGHRAARGDQPRRAQPAGRAAGRGRRPAAAQARGPGATCSSSRSPRAAS